jgi:urease accessory protein
MRAIAVRPAGSWPFGEQIDEIMLDHDRRHRRRIKLVTASGADLLLDLAQTAHLREGDALVIEAGGLVHVHAQPEELLDIAAPDADTLARLAWHLGNRHLPVQFLPGAIRILADHVIAEMIVQMGGAVQPVTAPFDPEQGAYHHG